MLTKTNNPFFAVQCVFKGLLWLGKAPLRKFLVVPILINLVLYSAAFILGYLYLPDLIAQLIPTQLHWLSWLITPLFFIGFIVIGFFSFTVLANLIAAPFYDKLSAQTLLLILQANPPEQQENTDSESEIIEPSWLHTILDGLQRVGYLVKWMLALLIISIIPGLNLLAPLLWAIFGAWGCALEFFAYPLENKKMLFPAQKNWLADARLGALSFGSLILVGLSLPFFNLVVAPAAVIAATLYVHKLDETAK